MSPIEHFMQSQESKRSEISSDIAISSSALGIRSFKMKKIQVSNHKFSYKIIINYEKYSFVIRKQE